MALAISVSSEGEPALAQVNGPLRRLEWKPYRPSPAEPDRGQDVMSEETVEADSDNRRPSARTFEGLNRRSPAASSVAPAVFQAPAEEQARQAAARGGYHTRASANSTAGTYRRPGSTSRVVPAGFQARVDPEPRMPAGNQAVLEYPDESPDIGPYRWDHGDRDPGDCTPGWYRPGWCGPYGPCDFPLQRLQGHLWVRGEYLLWWTQGSPMPPLLTTSPVGTGVDVAGVLGQPGTDILFGDSRVSAGVRSGERITLGWWLLPCHGQGIEASYLGLGRSTARFHATSDETPILARPYFDLQADAEAAMLVAYPGVISGSSNVDASTELQSLELLWRRRLFSDCRNRLDFLIGYRYAILDERLRIGQFSEWVAQQGLIIPGTTKSVFDLFDTQSQFNGAELGLAYQERVGRWALETRVKIGLGNTHSRVLIDGSTVTTVPGGGSATFTGGLLAQETNIGRSEQNHFAVIPEVGLTLGCDLTCRLRATFGYTFLYWSRVARPADQIDRNLSQLPPEPPTGAQRPALAFSMSDFWAQGLNFGLEYQF